VWSPGADQPTRLVVVNAGVGCYEPYEPVTGSARKRAQNVECVISSELNRKTVMPDLARPMDLVMGRDQVDTCLQGAKCRVR